MKKFFHHLVFPLLLLMLAGNIAYASSKEARAIVTSGDAKHKSGNYKEAAALYTKAIEFEPKQSHSFLSEVYFKRGYAKAALGDTEGAKADYRISLDLDRTPINAEAFYHQGLAKIALGEIEGAKYNIRKAAMQGNMDARKWLREHDPKNAEFNDNFEALALLESGKVKLGKKDYAAAISDFSRAVEIDRILAAAWYYRGTAKRVTGDLAGCKADFSMLLEVDRTPINAEAYFNRGFAKAYLGDKEGALADFNKAIILDPNYATAFAERGKLKEAMGDKAGALADFQKAENLGKSASAGSRS
ncbi:MAG: tetratricopeptide repeat protein [Chlorobiaceae bacterium]|nr:tetratricopeptide repeat protein [Chlorobiaceae bacterium]NTW11192.1 tetratricopeptide repeat protein [Chlorobiaceae bacterium]